MTHELWFMNIIQVHQYRQLKKIKTITKITLYINLSTSQNIKSNWQKYRVDYWNNWIINIIMYIVIFKYNKQFKLQYLQFNTINIIIAHILSKRFISLKNNYYLFSMLKNVARIHLSIDYVNSIGHNITTC